MHGCGAQIQEQYICLPAGSLKGHAVSYMSQLSGVDVVDRTGEIGYCSCQVELPLTAGSLSSDSDTTSS
jgi:hypothetical protein